jgi:hypothetical protein
MSEREKDVRLFYFEDITYLVLNRKDGIDIFVVYRPSRFLTGVTKKTPFYTFTRGGAARPCFVIVSSVQSLLFPSPTKVIVNTDRYIIVDRIRYREKRSWCLEKNEG